MCGDTNDQYVVFADIINKITRTSGKVRNVALTDLFYLTKFYVFSLSVCADLVRDLHQLDVDSGPTDDANQIQVGNKYRSVQELRSSSKLFRFF